jgi:hypothetical protein
MMVQGEVISDEESSESDQSQQSTVVVSSSRTIQAAQPIEWGPML